MQYRGQDSHLVEADGGFDDVGSFAAVARPSGRQLHETFLENVAAMMQILAVASAADAAAAAAA